MYLSWMVFFFSVFSIFYLFRKKLLSLLMIEISFISLIFLFFFFSYNNLSDSGHFAMLMFLGFMVLDSVLGLCCLVISSRNSTPFLNLFFSS